MKTFSALLILLMFASVQIQAAEPGGLKIGERLPEIQMRGLNGPNKSLTSYRGKPLIINVWASWCGPCRAEMASLEQLAWLESSGEFNIIGVSTDDYSEKALTFLNSRNTTIRHYVDQNLVIEKALGAERIPLTVLIDSQGRVIDKVFGAKSWSDPEMVVLIRQTLFSNTQ